MATVYVDVDTNFSALAYNYDDIIEIRYGAVLTMDSHITKNPRTIQCITSGTFQITNTSTTTPIRLTMSTNTGDLRFEKNGKFIARGDMIELTAGTGLASQTWDFSVSPLDRITYPTYVEVETAVGSGVYEPWMIVCTAGKTITYSASIFSTNECGKVVFWNDSTSVLSVGDGTNGNYLASGQKIRIPNIVIHSGAIVSAVANRSQVELNPAGYADLECVNFTNAMYLGGNSAKYVRLYRVGSSATIAFQTSNGSMDYNYVSLTHDTEQNATNLGLIVTGILGTLTLNNITALVSGATLAANNFTYVSNNMQLTEIKNCKFIMPKDRDASGNRAIFISQNPLLTNIENMVVIGTRISIDVTNDCRILNCKHADRLNTTSTTAIPAYAFYFSACQNISIINFSNAGIAAPRSAFVFVDPFCINVNIYVSTYDCDLNTPSLISAWTGSTVGFFNCSFTDLQSNSGPTMDSPATMLCDHLTARNIKATFIGTRQQDATPYGVDDLVPGTPTNYQGSFPMAYGHNSSSLIDSGLTAATGSIIFKAFGEWTGYNTLTGTAQYDWNGLVEIPANNDTVEFISPVFHAITAFQNSNPYYTYYEGGAQTTASNTAPSTMTVQFAIRNPGGTWTALATVSAANLSTAIAGLSGYDSDVGIEIKILITGVGADVTRNFGAVWWFTDLDNTWLASDASLTIDGAALTDIVRLKRDSDDSVIATFTGYGTFEFYCGTDYATNAYLTRSTAADVLICSTKADPFELTYGDNGEFALFSGDEVQLAHSEEMRALINEIDTYELEVLKLTGYNVTRSGNIITIYESDGITVWRRYDLSSYGRIRV